LRKRPEVMPTYDDQSDDALLERGEKRRQGGDWNRPLLMAGIGLVLMLGGYAATTFVPQTLQRAGQAHQVEELRSRQLEELRQRAAERQAEGEDDGLNDRLKQFQPPRRDSSPYLLLGRLAIYGGAYLFVMAGVLMYRNAPPPKESEVE
jgi:hypothetical protein